MSSWTSLGRSLRRKNWFANWLLVRLIDDMFSQFTSLLCVIAQLAMLVPLQTCGGGSCGSAARSCCCSPDANESKSCCSTPSIAIEAMGCCSVKARKTKRVNPAETATADDLQFSCTDCNCNVSKSPQIVKVERRVKVEPEHVGWLTVESDASPSQHDSGLSGKFVSNAIWEMYSHHQRQSMLCAWLC